MHELHRKQYMIEKIASRLQYSVLPNSLYNKYFQNNNSNNNSNHSKYNSNINMNMFNIISNYNDVNLTIWDPPFPDATSIIITRILDSNTIEPIQGFTDEQLRISKCQQNDIVRNHIDYAGLFKGGTQHLVNGKLWKKFKCDSYIGLNK